MKRKFYGNIWRYSIPDKQGTVKGTIEIPYDENEEYARFKIRKKLNLKRLPKGTKVYPDWPSS